ncbi:MAG: hypothetical protein HETSPECPRED_008067 [Heterodermia speciosa]|uniref:SPT2 chromatin protein n=1 Tax=Heterodermia speciosa TaxID=116794 RepID=A0A8H3ICD1_9LECA|nr:MAG: hypothetical protein HETSPECPRED_008067 [Heterodermia speciosa]
MSFLNSVLSSIGDKERTSPPQHPTSSNGRNLKGETVVPHRESASKTSIVQTLPLSNKRKAEDVLSKANEKAIKTNQDDDAQNSTAPTSGKLPQASPSATTQNAPKKPSLHTVPYRGTSRPSAAESTAPSKSTPKELKRSVAAPFASAKPAANAEPRKPPAVVAPSSPAADGVKVPKKGSYAEIMARAKAASTAPSVGVIKHQPRDKKAPSDKKELLLQKKGLTGKPNLNGKAGHSRTSSGDGSGESRPGSSGRQDGPVKKKAPEIAYKGTAKPKPQPTYKGTMKMASVAALPSHKKPSVKQDTRKSTVPKSRRREYSENEEDEEEEEEDYGSEESDMEAGYSDVEEEETKAAKIARKEDEFELKMEAEMKRQKEARKKREAEIARNQRRDNY